MTVVLTLKELLLFSNVGGNNGKDERSRLSRKRANVTEVKLLFHCRESETKLFPKTQRSNHSVFRRKLSNKSFGSCTPCPVRGYITRLDVTLNRCRPW